MTKVAPEGGFSLLYPEKFEDCKMNIPAEPNVKFSAVIKAPKKYVWEALNMTKADGGDIVPKTPGTAAPGDPYWPGAANDMERIVDGPLVVHEKTGGVKCPADGDWTMEWKAGAPYFTMPLPVRCCMFTSAHVRVTFKDGPKENETTLVFDNYHQPSCCNCMTICCLQHMGVIAGFFGKAPANFKKGTHIGPKGGVEGESMER